MTILEEAQKLVDGDRQEQYGDPVEHWTKISKIVSLLLGYEVPPEDCVTILKVAKMVRERNKHKRDNLRDDAGYLYILDKLGGCK